MATYGVFRKEERVVSKPPVLWIGSQEGMLREELLERLETHGFFVRLVEALRLHPKAVIVVCDHGDRGSSRQVPASLEKGIGSSPVVVLVEQREFGDYYDLMKKGASFYCEQSENPGGSRRPFAGQPICSLESGGQCHA